MYICIFAIAYVHNICISQCDLDSVLVFLFSQVSDNLYEHVIFSVLYFFH